MKAPTGDLVSIEAREKTDAWSERARDLFTELLEDATTELQRELLNRSVAAGHSSAEVHAFADALRGLSDAAAFEACTLERDSAPDYGVVELLRAEADPIFAFKLKGGELSPTEAPQPKPPEAPAARAYAPPGAPGRARPAFDEPDPRFRKRPSGAFDGDVAIAMLGTAGNPARDLGGSPADPPHVAPIDQGSRPPVQAATQSGFPMQDLLNESLQALGLSYHETGIDGPGEPKLEEALIHAGTALRVGMPVAVALGPSPGLIAVYALMLQVQISGKNRAFQLFDVVSQEIAWVNEGDLLARTELPFSSKSNRRITRIAIPTGRS